MLKVSFYSAKQTLLNCKSHFKAVIGCHGDEEEKGLGESQHFSTENVFVNNTKYQSATFSDF